MAGGRLAAALLYGHSARRLGGAQGQGPRVHAAGGSARACALGGAIAAGLVEAALDSTAHNRSLSEVGAVASGCAGVSAHVGLAHVRLEFRANSEGRLCAGGHGSLGAGASSALARDGFGARPSDAMNGTAHSIRYGASVIFPITHIYTI